MIRITADWDTKDKFIIALNLLKCLTFVRKIKWIKINPSARKGYHLEIWSTQRYTLKQQYHIRAKIGDDKNRIRLDKIRKIGRNTLFDKKTK